LHGGNPEEMFETLKNLKSSLDKNTIILPGHDYSVKRESTIEEEIAGNPFMHFQDLNKFVEYRMSAHDKTRVSPYDSIDKI
jgi:glyoxylase-like metal-dependent hydrolase (beta-lactamase superfamily II)